MPEATSTARPSRVRLSGFLAVAIGGAMLGIGALMTWGSVGFLEEVDPTGSASIATPGIDLWEGLVVLAASVLALLGILALRLVKGGLARRVICVAMILVGLAASILALSVAIGAEERLVQTEGLDAYARALSEQLDLPYAQVRADIEEFYREDLVVETAPGVWIAAAGGIVAFAGGILSLAWIRELEREPSPGSA